jgi:hypothetical protein
MFYVPRWQESIEIETYLVRLAKKVLIIKTRCDPSHRSKPQRVLKEVEFLRDTSYARDSEGTDVLVVPRK